MAMHIHQIFLTLCLFLLFTDNDVICQTVRQLYRDLLKKYEGRSKSFAIQYDRLNLDKFY